MAAAQREEIGVCRFGILAAVLARGSDPRGRLPDSPLLEGFDADRNLLIPTNAISLAKDWTETARAKDWTGSAASSPATPATARR